MPVATALHVLVRDDDEVRDARPDLLVASGTAVDLRLLPGYRSHGDALDLSPRRSDPQRPGDRLGRGGSIPGGAVLSRHQGTTSPMNAAATVPSAFPVSPSAFLAPRTRNE
jgi:hypothetical protein